MHGRRQVPIELSDVERQRHLLGAARRAALAAVADETVAQDAASHALERLLERCTGDDPLPPVTWTNWVRTAADRFARDEVRRRGREHLAGRAGSALPQHNNSGADGEGSWRGRGVMEEALRRRGRGAEMSVGSLVAEREAAAWQMASVVAVLGEQNARIFVAKDIHRQPVVEIAEREGLSEKAVERRLARARAALRAVAQDEQE